jgi:hypothetical protein
MLDNNGNLTHLNYLALVSITKNNHVVGILVLDVRRKHPLLPRQVVCASAIKDPTWALGCINLVGSLPLPKVLKNTTNHLLSAYYWILQELRQSKKLQNNTRGAKQTSSDKLHHGEMGRQRGLDIMKGKHNEACFIK